MSPLITFDDERSIATLSLKDWPAPLDQAVRRYFVVEEDRIRLDCTHVSDVEPDYGYRGDWRSPRARLMDDLANAAKIGPLKLFYEITYGRNSTLEGSSSILNALRFRDGDWAIRLMADSLDRLRAMMITEGTLQSGWLAQLLKPPHRASFLKQRDIFEALIARTLSSEAYWSALALLKPKEGDDGWAFGALADYHWAYTEAFIADAISSPWASRNSSAPMLAQVFRHSRKTQDSRWACEQALSHAHPSALGAYVCHSRALTTEDVRALFRRQRAAEKDEAEALNPGISGALEGLGRNLGGSLPSDLVLAGLWRGPDFAKTALPTPTQRRAALALSELPARAEIIATEGRSKPPGLAD